jgi:hypothetical protein
MSQRPYNAINGQELKKQILADIDRQLSQDTRFGLHLTYPQVAYSLAISIVTWPADAGSLVTHAQGRVGTAPENPLQIPPRPEAPAVGSFVTDGESPRPVFVPSVDAALESMRPSVPNTAPLNPAEEAALLLSTGGRPKPVQTTNGDPIVGGAVAGPRVIENPDQTRRDLGLPVPMPQTVPGGPTGSQIVDVPAADIPKPAPQDVF